MQESTVQTQILPVHIALGILQQCAADPAVEPQQPFRPHTSSERTPVRADRIRNPILVSLPEHRLNNSTKSPEKQAGFLRNPEKSGTPKNGSDPDRTREKSARQKQTTLDFSNPDAMVFPAGNRKGAQMSID